MKVYIIKPKSAPVNDVLKYNIETIGTEIEFVDYLVDCDIAVLQNGWTRSTYAIKEKEMAEKLHKRIEEGYMYERFKVHLN